MEDCVQVNYLKDRLTAFNIWLNNPHPVSLHGPSPTIENQCTRIFGTTFMVKAKKRRIWARRSPSIPGASGISVFPTKTQSLCGGPPYHDCVKQIHLWHNPPSPVLWIDPHFPYTLCSLYLSCHVIIMWSLCDLLFLWRSLFCNVYCSVTYCPGWLHCPCDAYCSCDYCSHLL